MKVDGKSYRSIWDDDGQVRIIDQRWLPYEFRIASLETIDEFATAIRDMWVRGAPLIGATAAYGMACAANSDPSTAGLTQARQTLAQTRPTAINLNWALDRCMGLLAVTPEQERAQAALLLAREISDEDVEINHAIGGHGLKILQDLAANKPGPLNVLTHCNAGWLATVDWGTATSPIYQAHDAGMDIHVWVDETRPRNQGALTAWELGQHGVPHTYITDNAGGHLMQNGLVDVVITGTDRTAANGDVANKIGTYLKALAATDNDIPFYVALPSPTIDWTLDSGAKIPIEDRPADEVRCVQGMDSDRIGQVAVSPFGSPVANPAFDVTPARLVTGLITERGVCPASTAGLSEMFKP